MYRPVTPQIPPQEPKQHYGTPTKAAVHAAVDFCQKSNTPYYKEPREPKQHYSTPTKAAAHAAVDFCQNSNTPYYKEDVFRTFNVNRRQGYEWLRTGVTRRMHNDPELEETRGRKPIISTDKKSGRWRLF